MIRKSRSSLHNVAKNKIELFKTIIDMKEVNYSLEKMRIYSDDKITIKYAKRQEIKNLDPRHKYVVSIKDNCYSYIGYLNEDLDRNGIGKNINANGDVYFGNWNDNVKNKYGIYSYDVENRNDIEVEIYHGKWENDHKTQGIYIWKKKNENINSTLENSIIDGFIGTLSQGNYKRGIYINQCFNYDEFNRYIYFGNFEDGIKKDEKAFFYSTLDNTIFFGKIEDDKLIQGHVTDFENNQINSISYFDGNNFKHLEEFTKSQVYDEIKLFVEIINSNDFFQIIYDEYLQCKDLIVNKYNSVDEFSSDKFEDDFKFLMKYTDILKFIEPLMIN